MVNVLRGSHILELHLGSPSSPEFQLFPMELELVYPTPSMHQMVRK